MSKEVLVAGIENVFMNAYSQFVAGILTILSVVFMSSRIDIVANSVVTVSSLSGLGLSILALASCIFWIAMISKRA